ncbi:MAG: hypothetical protein IT480_18490 [Gammaproteobacteria bacterium]|nr:hypothetical protein [Gammaproteobacteria bacterium]
MTDTAALRAARGARELIRDALLHAETAADQCRRELARLDAQIAEAEDHDAQERAEYAAQARAERAELAEASRASLPGYYHD